jgi:hypothetical protein
MMVLYDVTMITRKIPREGKQGKTKELCNTLGGYKCPTKSYIYT